MEHCQWYSKRNYNVGTETIHSIEVLKSSLCDYKNAYILVRGDITGRAAPTIHVAFKNCAPLTKCILQSNKTIHDTENLDLVVPMYNLIVYSSNYSKTTRSLWFY